MDSSTLCFRFSLWLKMNSDGPNDGRFSRGNFSLRFVYSWKLILRPFNKSTSLHATDYCGRVGVSGTGYVQKKIYFNCCSLGLSNIGKNVTYSGSQKS